MNRTDPRVAAHKARMAKRRTAQLARTPGLTPVRNTRVDGMIQAETMRLTLAGSSAIDAQADARSNVAKRLPQAPATKLYRFRPSKNDSAAYRKAA